MIDEERKHITIIKDASHPGAYNDDTSRYKDAQRLVRATNPHELVRATFQDHVYFGSDGEVEDLEEEDEEDYLLDADLKEALDQEHNTSSLSDLIRMAKDIDAMAECALMSAEGDKGGMDEEQPESAVSVADER
jgi:hypothetical protein